MYTLRNNRFTNTQRLQQAANGSTMKPNEPDIIAVAIIQKSLVDMGYHMPRSTLANGSLDGDYGRETTNQVVQFQQNHALSIDGYIGKNTMRKLDQKAPALGHTDLTPHQPDPTPEPPASSNKSVILTFDDGPSPISALNSTLHTLRQNNIKAEFYVLGKEVIGNTSATKRISDQGHRVQNHSWSHIDLARASERKVRSELQRTQDAILQATGRRATKIRPPYGNGGWPNRSDRELKRVAESLSLKVENWDVDTLDWKRPAGIGTNKLASIKRQLRRRRNQSRLNILMHVNTATARDLPNFIRKLKQWGYSFARP